MALNSVTPNQRFWQSHHAIAKAHRALRLCRIALSDALTRVPVFAIALNKQVKLRNVEVKNIPLARALNLKFREKINALRRQRFPNLSLNRCFSFAASITTKRAISTAYLSLRSVQGKWCITNLAIPGDRRFTSAGQRAEVVTVSVGLRDRKDLTALGAPLFDGSFTACLRAEFARFAATLIKRECPPALVTDKGRITVPDPSTLDSARATVWATKDARGWSLWFSLSTVQTVGVNIFISHGVNLANRLTFWLGPRECFEHLRGLLILPQVAH